MSEKNKRDAVGKALYLEFRKDESTFQVVVTPDIVDLTGKVIPSYFVRRKVSSWHPRRAWNIDRTLAARPTDSLATRIYPETELKRDAFGAFEKVADDYSQRLIEQTAGHALVQSIRSLVGSGWSLFKQPIAVEVAYEDIEALVANKTPNSLVRRVNRARNGLGWGDALFNEPAPTPATTVVV